MTQFMVELVLVLAVVMLFGYMVGIAYTKAKYKEEYEEKMAKLTKIISEKNQAIIQIKSELRVLQRINSDKKEMFERKDKELREKTLRLTELKNDYQELEEVIKEIQKEFQMIKHDKELLLKELKEKKQLLKNQDDIILMLEKKIKELSSSMNNVHRA